MAEGPSKRRVAGGRLRASLRAGLAAQSFWESHKFLGKNALPPFPPQAEVRVSALSAQCCVALRSACPWTPKHKAPQCTIIERKNKITPPTNGVFFGTGGENDQAKKNDERRAMLPLTKEREERLHKTSTKPPSVHKERKRAKEEEEGG